MDKKIYLLLLCLVFGIISGIAQNIPSVSGKVLSEEDGEPVIGASIRVEESQAGTITDENGRFVLKNLPASVKTLVRVR